MRLPAWVSQLPAGMCGNRGGPEQGRPWFRMVFSRLERSGGMGGVLGAVYASRGSLSRSEQRRLSRRETRRGVAADEQTDKLGHSSTPLILPKAVASNPPIESMACGAFSCNCLGKHQCHALGLAGRAYPCPDSRARIPVVSRKVFVLRWFRRSFGGSRSCPSGVPLAFSGGPLAPVPHQRSQPGMRRLRRALDGLGRARRGGAAGPVPRAARERLAAAVRIQRRRRGGSAGQRLLALLYAACTGGGTSTRSTPWGPITSRAERAGRDGVRPGMRGQHGDRGGGPVMRERRARLPHRAAALSTMQENPMQSGTVRDGP